MVVKILQLNQSGHPQTWLTREQAVVMLVKGRIVWQLGDVAFRMQGGINRCGERSRVELAAIVACSGRVSHLHFAPALNNALLFRRDGNLCLYCGARFPSCDLTRDHVVPRSQGGGDHWQNVVAACRRCNHKKGANTPEQAGMPLLAVPFVPNPFEFLFLANRHILADQMEYLNARFSCKRDWPRLA